METTSLQGSVQLWVHARSPIWYVCLCIQPASQPASHLCIFLYFESVQNWPQNDCSIYIKGDREMKAFMTWIGHSSPSPLCHKKFVS